MTGLPSGGESDRLRDLFGQPGDLLAEGSTSDRLGRLAMMRGYLSVEQLQTARSEQARRGGGVPLEAILMEQGVLAPADLARLQQETAIPHLPGRYRVLEPLGEGALAVVLRGFDSQLGRTVAIKILKAPLASQGMARERLKREAQALARIIHPHVVAVYDFGEEEGCIYLVMELVTGRSLRRLMEDTPRDHPRLLALLVKVAAGVHHAHENGIVHRDLKPENILVADSGDPKVADFGLAHLFDAPSRLTATGARLGTPFYMAPEQVEGQGNAVSAATDVYALGAILYEMLTGRPPHPGASLAEVFSGILSGQPQPPRRLRPDLPADLETIALKALEKDPRKRYPSARAFAQDLERHLAGRPIEARLAGPMERCVRRARRNPVAWTLALGALASSFLAAVLWLAGREKTVRMVTDREEALRAVRETAQVSLEAALQVRRAGANDQMAQFLPRLESAYRQAVRRAPGLAEVEYLMGRMRRALMEDTIALDHQQAALEKDPLYAPALYERVILLSKEYGRERRLALESLKALPSGPFTAREAREAVPDQPRDVEGLRTDLARMRLQIVQDCRVLEERARETSGPPAVDGAKVLAARGILAYAAGRFAEAKTALREAVRQGPHLEEAWETLARAVLEEALEGKSGTMSTWREIEALLTEALSHDRGYLPHWIVRAETRSRMARAQTSTEGEWLPLSRAAEEDAREALRMGRPSAEAWRVLGIIQNSRGVARMRLGEDPARDFEDAVASFTEAIRIDPLYVEAWWRRGLARTYRAEDRLDRGRDPLPEFGAAEQDLLHAVKVDEAFVGAWNQLGYLLTSRGDWRARQGKDPLEDFTRGEAALTEALRLKPDHVSAWKNRGKLRSRRADHGANPGADFAAAEEDYTEALRLKPDDARGLAERGDLRRRRSAWRGGRNEPAQAASDAASAVADLERAIRLDPRLQREFGESLERARARSARRQE
jgi:serine/threonine-protein kinase